MDKYAVRVSPQAARQMGECVQFVERENRGAGERLRQRLVESIRSLEVMPRRFPFFTEPYIPRNQYRKMFVEEYYPVLYQIREDVVLVEYVLDCRREYKWLKNKNVESR